MTNGYLTVFVTWSALDEVKGLDNALTHALNLIRAGHQDKLIAAVIADFKRLSGDA